MGNSLPCCFPVQSAASGLPQSLPNLHNDTLQVSRLVVRSLRCGEQRRCCCHPSPQGWWLSPGVEPDHRKQLQRRISFVLQYLHHCRCRRFCPRRPTHRLAPARGPKCGVRLCIHCPRPGSMVGLLSCSQYAQGTNTSTQQYQYALLPERLPGFVPSCAPISPPY